MEQISDRATLLVQLCIAHFVGLFVTGVYGSIGTTTGLAGNLGVAIFLGGMISTPWFVALLLAVWFFAEWMVRHLSAFLVGGPIIACASYAMLLGTAFWDAIAISCVASSISLLGLRVLAANLAATFMIVIPAKAGIHLQMHP